MKRRLAGVLVFSFVAIALALAGENVNRDPAAKASPIVKSLPGVTVSPGVTPAPSPGVAAVAPVDFKSLLKEFQKAQRSEIKALEHRQKMELKEVRASQAARQKEFEGREREVRHKFFADHPKGAERRDYVKEFLDRRKAMLVLMTDEYKKRMQEQEVRRKAIKDEQTSKQKEFNEAIQKKERPRKQLWPQ